MALDPSVLAQIRDHVGSTPDDATIEATWLRDDVGTADLAALSILRRRLADLEASPETFNVQGDYSQSTGKNLDALAKKIADLETVCGVGASALTVGRLTRIQGR